MGIEWKSTGFNKVNGELHNINFCITCKENCRLVLPLNEDPPTKCIKNEEVPKC